jgi:hypothetical protein
MNQQMLYDGYYLTVEPHHKIELIQDDARLDAVGLTPMLFAASYLADAIQRNCPEAISHIYSSSRHNENATCRAHIEKFIRLQVGIPDEVKPGASLMTSSPMTSIKNENHIAKELSAPIPVALSSSKRKHRSGPPQPCFLTKKRVNPASPTKLTAVGA